LAINVPGEIDATEFPAEAINVPGEIDATVFPAEAVNGPDETSPDTIAGVGGAVTAEIGLIPALEIVDEFVDATVGTSELLGAMTLLYSITKT